MSTEVPRFNVELGQCVKSGPIVLYVPDDKGRPLPVVVIPAKELPIGCQLQSIVVRYSMGRNKHSRTLYPSLRLTGLPHIDKDVWIPRLPSGLVLP